MVYFPPPSPQNEWDSDEEEDGIADQEPLDITWVSIGDHEIGISSLPGNRLGGARRSLPADMETLKTSGVQLIFVLCTEAELRRCQVPMLLMQYEEKRLSYQHFPMAEDNIPSIILCLQIVFNIRQALLARKKLLLHCINGCGQSSLIVALYAMILDTSLTPNNAIEWIRRVRGPAAINTIKQYNFIMDIYPHLDAIRYHVLHS